MTENKDLFQPGPLYKYRKKIVEYFKKIPLKTGDIVFNASDIKGPFHLPFARWIQKFTNSPYSHATTMLEENKEFYAIDVTDHGLRKVRLLDWFDDWDSYKFCVYRLKNRSSVDESNFKNAIARFLEDDPDYDYNFNNPNNYYCTEGVKRIYNECGYDLEGAYLLKDIVPKWFYYCTLVGNYFFKLFSNSSLPKDVPITIVGNPQKGMMASPLIERIFEYDALTDVATYFTIPENN